MKIIDNVNTTLKDDLVDEINKGSKVSIAAASFSIFAFAELKKQLKNLEEFRFIFTAPAFVEEKATKEKRELSLESCFLLIYASNDDDCITKARTLNGRIIISTIKRSLAPDDSLVLFTNS